MCKTQILNFNLDFEIYICGSKKYPVLEKRIRETLARN